MGRVGGWVGGGKHKTKARPRGKATTQDTIRKNQNAISRDRGRKTQIPPRHHHPPTQNQKSMETQRTQYIAQLDMKTKARQKKLHGLVRFSAGFYRKGVRWMWRVKPIRGGNNARRARRNANSILPLVVGGRGKQRKPSNIRDRRQSRAR